LLLCRLLEERRRPEEVHKAPSLRDLASGAEWKIAMAALVLMAAGLAALHFGKPRLGKPGLAMEQGVLTNEFGNVIRQVRVRLPSAIPGFQTEEGAISKWEEALPGDTTFGRKVYRQDAASAPITLSAVMMKTDRTSIHRPQICIVGQGWLIDETKIISIPVARPGPYALQATCMQLSKEVTDGAGVKRNIRGVYIYWFVSENRLTPGHSEALWFITRDLLLTGTMYPWAYVSCFSHCLPGQENALLERMKEVIAAATPEFQLITNEPKQSALLPKGDSLQ
jgi:hypothetical protein